MTDFREQDLTGARFERVSLRSATFTQVYFNDARMHRVDLSGAQVRGALFNESRMRGVELVDVEISGELQNVVVNGVDIAPLVDAELNRRMPERARMRPDDDDGFREAWAILERLWEGTVARARTFPEAALHHSVDDEWSFIQTLRHLNFASAAWVGRMILGNPRRGTSWTCRGTRRPGGTVSRGTARHDPRSTRCSRSEANVRRWSATSWNHSPRSNSPAR
jgi:uncharacterized protein YjbI with pentapeptide repeats